MAYSINYAPQEIHYHITNEVQDSVKKPSLNHKICSTTVKIIQLNPSLLLGRSHLFDYNPVNQTIVLSSSFQKLLELLVKLEELDSKALIAKSLQELNSVLQQAQGIRGGLMRKPGTERWHLEDNSTKQQYSQIFNELFQELGFILPKSIDNEMNVDHCFIFGGLCQRMETRIIETVTYLKNNLDVTGHVFLLGSDRQLIDAEIELLKSKIEKLDESKKIVWKEQFKGPKQYTEANAFLCLWECLVPEELQTLLKDKLVSMRSSRVGNSYNGQGGHRVTTEVTIQEWVNSYSTNETQSIFSLTEQPYLRLPDMLRFNLLSNGKKAEKDDLIDRIKNTTFHFAIPNPNSSPLISVILDEIGRNVFWTVDALEYIESLEK